jgi:maleate isomerase
MTARVGLIIPSSNRMVEQEMVHAFPPGVQAHVARLRMTGAHHSDLASLLPRIEDAARTLIDARCEVVAFHCTATSMEEGVAGEERILAALERARAPQALTTATAIRNAFETLGARNIVLVTPYDARTTDGEAEFLRSAGYDVLHAVGHALAGSDAYCATPPQFWRERTLEAARKDADAYLVSCANIAVFGVIEELERRLNRPVVTSNQAVIWAALRALDWRKLDGCPGRLFTYPARAHGEPAVQAG